MKEIKFNHIVLGTIILLAIGLFLSWNLILGSIYFEGGTGTELDPYQISTIEQMQNITMDRNGYYVLVNDVDASNTSTWNDGKGFNPVAELFDPSNNKAFTGTFDGDNRTISNLYINRPTETAVSLFGGLSNAEIKNLKLVDCDIEGDRYVAGLVSSQFTSTVSNCMVDGTITGHGENVGGVVGWSRGDVINCYMKGSVHGVDTAYRVGGLVGYTYDSTIQKSYSTATITSESGEWVGGLIGANREATQSYCYWDTQTSGRASSDLGTGYTTLQMKSQVNFENWDFENVWYIDSNNDGYPHLSSEHNFVDPNAEEESEEELPPASSSGGSSTPTIVTPTEEETIIELNTTTENTTISTIEDTNTNIEDEPFEFNMYQISTVLLLFCLIGVVVYKRK